MNATLTSISTISGDFRVVNLTGEDDLEFIRVILDCVPDEICVDGFFTEEDLITKSQELHRGKILILVMPDIPRTSVIDTEVFPLLKYLAIGDLLISTNSEILCISSIY